LAAEIPHVVPEHIVIEQLQDFPDNFAAYVCHGRLTKADLAGVTPHIQDKLARHKKLRAYVELAPDFAGVNLNAQWDHMKFSFRHPFDFERGAFVSDSTWMNRALQVLAPLIPGHWRAFPSAAASRAREWIVENQR
jgi:SpoIIAA-like